MINATAFNQEHGFVVAGQHHSAIRSGCHIPQWTEAMFKSRGCLNLDTTLRTVRGLGAKTVKVNRRWHSKDLKLRLMTFGNNSAL